MPASPPATHVFQISGKDLGALTRPGACPRCAWVKLRQKSLPFQIFPGIFSSIDAYSKRAVHGWFDRHGSAPPWLAKVGDFVRYHEPPHWSKFFLVDDASGAKLTGAPDAVLERRDGTLVIADYKTARHTAGQDELLPVYDTQLNAYAAIAARLGWAPVTGLVLLYMEPHDEGATNDARQDERGYHIEFHAKAVELTPKPESIPPLLARARALRDLDAPPAGREGCKDCAALDALVGLVARPA